MPGGHAFLCAVMDWHSRLGQSLREQLSRSDKALVGNKGYRRFLKSNPDHQ